MTVSETFQALYDKTLEIPGVLSDQGIVDVGKKPRLQRVYSREEAEEIRAIGARDVIEIYLAMACNILLDSFSGTR